MKKGIVLIVVMVMLFAASGFCADKPKSIKEDLKVTRVEGNGGKDGYIEIATRSGNVYRVWPCGEVKKLTWKEIAPNTELSATSITAPNQVFYYDGSNGWSTR